MYWYKLNTSGSAPEKERALKGDVWLTPGLLDNIRHNVTELKR